MDKDQPIISSSPFRGLLFSATAVILVLFLLEIILRAVSALGLLSLPRETTIRERWAREGWAVDRDLNWALIPNNTSLRGGARCTTNSYGLRDQEIPLEKPAGTYRILVIGDSTVLGFAIPFEKTFSEVLETMLNERSTETRFDVINAGVPGYSIYNCFEYLKRDGIRFDPDVIVLQTNFNDRRYILSRDYEDGEDFYHDFHRRLRFRETADASYLYRGLRRILVGLFDLSRGDSLLTDTFDYRRIDMDDLHCRVEPERYRSILGELVEFARSRDIPVILIPLRDPPSQVDDLYRARSLAGEGRLKEAYDLMKNMDMLPFYRIIVAKTANEILAAHGREEKRVKTVPVQVEWMGTDGNVPIYLSDPYVEIMEEAAREPGVHIVGLDSVTIRQRELYIDYIHLNEEGHRLLAEELYMMITRSEDLKVPL